MSQLDLKAILSQDVLSIMWQSHRKRWSFITDSLDENKDVWRDQERWRNQNLKDKVKRGYLKKNFTWEHQMIKRTIWTQNIEMSKETIMSNEHKEFKIVSINLLHWWRE